MRHFSSLPPSRKAGRDIDLLENDDQPMNNKLRDIRSRTRSSPHPSENDAMQAIIRAALTFVIILADAGVAGAQQTIVGKWAIRSKCAAPLSTIIIEPMALNGEDFYCEFRKVVRRGDTVQWNGKCN